MKMERIVVDSYQSEVRDTYIDLVARTGERVAASVTLYTVTEPRTTGYLPSKVWIEQATGNMEMMFYCNPTLPAGARPFGDGPMYVWKVAVGSDITVEYDVEARVFVDQVLWRETVWYVFVCGEQHLGKLIAPKENV